MNFKELHTEASFWARSELKSNIANWFLAVGLIGSVYGSFKLPSEYKQYPMSIGVLSSVAGILNSRYGREAKGASRDLQAVSEQNRTNRYYEITKPVLAAANPQLETLRPFRWSTLVERPDLYPHLLLMGATGGGKSTLAENLAGLLGGDTFGIIPHWQVGEFSSCKAVFGDQNFTGAGADFDKRSFKPNTPLERWEDMLRNVKVMDGNDPIVTWEDIVSGGVKPSACQVFRALWFEMRRRYKLGGDGKFVGGEVINLIVDEFNSLANLPGLRWIWLELVREARKVGIRLILIVQQDDVKSLNIEGQGGIRESLTQIYLGSAADNRILELLGMIDDPAHRQYWQDRYKDAQILDRKCIVEKSWADLPSPGAWVKVPANAAQLTLPQPTSSISNDPVGVVPTKRKAIDYPRYELELFYKLAVAAANGGASKTNIIRKVWEFPKEDYQRGIKLWQRIETEVGRIYLVERQQTEDNVTEED